MTKQTFNYALLRYVPDPERMEPQNIGVVVQGPECTRLRLDRHFGMRKLIDARVYRRWRDFLEEEVEGAQQSIFRPSRQSPKFLNYLRSLTGDTVLMTPPLKFVTTEDMTIDGLVERLYSRLVDRRSEEEETASRPDGTDRGDG